MQPVANTCDLGFAFGERSSIGVDGVVAEVKGVIVRDGRTENEDGGF